MPLSDLEIYDLSKSLTSKEYAQEILTNFLPLVREAKMNDGMLTKSSNDKIAETLIPLDFRSLTPIRTTANGNCLYNSMSIALTGDESLAASLRLLTVAELFAHSEYYAQHPQFESVAQSSGYSVSTIINIFLSDQKAQDIYNGNISKLPRAIEVLAQETSKSFVFSSQFHLLALSSVIGKPIQSVYPEIPTSSRIRSALHGIFYPREVMNVVDKRKSENMVHIMWTNISKSPLHGWEPNHFVPLVNMSSKAFAKTYADAAMTPRHTPQINEYKPKRKIPEVPPFVAEANQEKQSRKHYHPFKQVHSPSSIHFSTKRFPRSSKQLRENQQSPKPYAQNSHLPKKRRYMEKLSVQSDPKPRYQRQFLQKQSVPPKSCNNAPVVEMQSRLKVSLQTCSSQKTVTKTLCEQMTSADKMFSRPKVQRKKSRSKIAKDKVNGKANMFDKTSVASKDVKKGNIQSFFVKKNSSETDEKTKETIKNKDGTNSLKHQEELLPLMGPDF